MKKLFSCLATAMLLSFVWISQASAEGTLAGTLIKNKAYADYNDANGNPRERVYSNEVTTEVSQVAAVAAEPPTATKTGAAGSDVFYASFICNYGNGPDVFDLTAVASASTYAGFTVTIYEDTNQNGIWDTSETTVITNTGTIEPDQCKYVIVVVSVPPGAAANDTSDVTLTATSQFDPNISDSSVLTTTVLTAALSITKTASPADPKPGDVITYAITGKNLGTTDALNVMFKDVIPVNTTYVLNSMKAGPIGSTYATAGPMTDANDVDYGYWNSGATQVELNWGTEPPFPPNGAGTGGVFYFQVTVNANVPAGTHIDNIGTASYQLVSGGQTYQTQSNQATSTVANDASILLDADHSATGNTGDQIVHPFYVYNNGNTADVVDLSYTSSSGWNWTFWYDADENGIPGTDGDYILIDTDADGKIDTGSIPYGGYAPILAVTTIPAELADGTVDTAIVTGISSIGPMEPDGTDIVTFTTTVKSPALSLTKTVSPEGPQPPGTELTYTVTVTNNGTGQAAAVVITDIVPMYTTYKPSSIKTGSSLATLTARSDASDSDGARFDSGSHAVLVPDGGTLTLGQGGQWVLQFVVTID